MKEISRFSFENSSSIIRDTVLLDDDGFYHINQQVFCDKGKVDAKTGLPIPTTSREDIHGKMDQQEYINWLSKALFMSEFTTTLRPIEKQWMIGEG